MTQRYQRREIGGTVVEIEDRIRAMDLASTVNAEEGSTAMFKVTIDDPACDYDVTGHRLFAIYEDEAVDPDDQYIAVGYIQRRRYKRGRSMITGAARLIEVDVADLNTILGRRVMTGSDCNRPAETDVERMQWAVLTNEAGLIDDDTYLSTANPVDMDACDYRGQYLMSVLEDCAEASGKNYFVTWLGPAFTEGDIESPWGTFSLFYDFVGSEVYDSAIFLTNVLADIDDLNVFAANAELERSPDTVYSGVYLAYDGGVEYDQDATTASNFARRDMIAPSANVKTSTKANARIDRMLADLDEEDDRLTISFLVRPVDVNRLRQGMRVQVKFPHLGTDYADWRWVRMLTRTVTQTATETGERRYLISGEFSGNPVVVGEGPGGGGGEEPPPDIDPPMATMNAYLAAGDPAGQESTEACYLYDGVTYNFAFAVAHNHAPPASVSNYIFVAAWRGDEGSGVHNQAFEINMGSVRIGTAIGATERIYTTSVPSGGTAGVTYARWDTHIRHGPYAGTNGYGSTVACTVTYVSGPDPRFP